VRILEELMTTPAREMSLLTVLQGARSSGSLAAAMGIEGGAQEIRFDGGLHSIAVHLADDLGEGIRTEWPVTVVRESDGVVRAEGPRGVVRARHAVVALAPSQAVAVSFEPALPTSRVELQRQMVMGSVIKVNAVYDRPFWREQGLSGLVMDFDGPVTYSVDNSPPDRELGVLVSFFAADLARHFSPLGPEARREAFVAQAERWFGPQSRELVYVDHDWTVEPFIGGGYSGVMRPGGWSTAGPALREPVGRVHWASSESSTEWTGYVEGALRAGRRAAAEILDELV
jgi:monoamine oxidase